MQSNSETTPQPGAVIQVDPRAAQPAAAAEAGGFRLPQMVAVPRERKPQANIPQTAEERRAIRQLLHDYHRERQLVTPLSMEELRQHTEGILDANPGIDRVYLDYMAVLLNNEAWRDELSSIPYERRLLLMPKCLRVEDQCPAPFDAFGLLCKQCGLCSIQDLQNEAERLGYAVLVAEGSALVMAMIETGQIEAIVGVSCLSVLEKAFPYTESAAIPCVAIPLLQDDCKDCTVDTDWVWDTIHLHGEDQTRRLDLDALRQEVDSWFATDQLDALLGPAREADPTEAIARRWLSAHGKRWRPFLTTCAYRALGEPWTEGEAPLPLRRLALAVECFHKASLIHDDIEDEDRQRYGEPTLHEQHGVAVALNVGDLLLGEGYRLIATSGAAPELIAQLLAYASDGQRRLCLGQGAELAWANDPRPLGQSDVLQIFRDKTAPAFEIALAFGATLAGADEDTLEALVTYSEAVGIAYQIKDDLDDLDNPEDGDDLSALRPSLPLAVAHNKAKGADRELLARAWRRELNGNKDDHAALAAQIDDPVRARCRELLEAYKQEAIRSLQELDSASLKGLLRRVVSKIFRIEIEGWCSEREAEQLGTQPTAEATPS